MMNAPLTLPTVNIFDDPNVLQTLWNYLGSTFTLGMPVLLISVALLLIPQLWGLIFDTFFYAKGGDELESRRERDDDTW